MPSPAAVPFCKLADATKYVACSWDLARDEAGRNHWVEFFKRHLNTLLKLGVEAAVNRGQAESEALHRADDCRREFYAEFDAFAANPSRFGRVTILTLDAWRDNLLRRWGFADPFADLKNRENEKMLPLLPSVCRQIDALPPAKQLDSLVLGVFAGNIFDMGADATAKQFLSSSPDFFATRSKIVPRPWLIDDYDRFVQRMQGPIHRKAVFFVDNAGSDFVLGAAPMIRWLAQRGTRVVLAANERPTLNDMTIADVRAWWPRILQAEPTMANLAIDLVSTGTAEPLIDLKAVSPELNAAAMEADLVILEGMGRGVESNLEAEFSCDAVHLAMIKDTAVAARHGGKVFDVICRYWAAK
ncbi:MAG TPA: ARMT1-like domain-containing protein [Tepidisphaeraceae bacterium]|jgi:type II pantothenate kinase|nr:ARMT1-like domain-containing protein [Tepidisphaeraceae bacterium]